MLVQLLVQMGRRPLPRNRGALAALFYLMFVHIWFAHQQMTVLLLSWKTLDTAQHSVTEVIFDRHQGEVRPLQTTEPTRGVPVVALHRLPSPQVRAPGPGEGLHRGHAFIHCGRGRRFRHD